MKLIGCHIENFGKIHDLDYSFTDGLNRILEDNGWGKSTFADFIFAMFYGFDGDQKRSIAENRRKRYVPWQQGTFGGSLTFEAGKKRYRIERVFGYKNAKEDTLAVYNADTNLRIRNYKGVPGEAVFSIDRDSFTRTVYIAQQDCGTDVTADIHAKIGHVSGETADMGNYEAVQRKLKETADSLTPTRKTGEINRINRRLSEMDAAILNKPMIEKRLTETEEKMEDFIERKLELEAGRNVLQKQIAEAGARKDRQTESRQLEDLRKREAEAYRLLNEAGKQFPGDIPHRQLVEEEIEAASELEMLEREWRSLELSAEDRQEFRRLQAEFEDGMPAAEKITEMRERLYRLNNRQKLAATKKLSPEEIDRCQALEEAFRDFLPGDEEVAELIRLWEERGGLKAEVRSDKNTARTLRNLLEGDGRGNSRLDSERASFSRDGFRKPRSSMARKAEQMSQKASDIGKRILAVLVLLFSAAAAIALGLVRHQPIPAMVLAGVGFLLALILWIAGRPGNYEEGEYDPFEEDEDEEGDEETREEYQRVIRQIRAKEKQVAEINRRVSDFLAGFAVEVGEADVAECLWQIRSEAKDYRRLKNRWQEYKQEVRPEEIRQEAKAIDAFLLAFFPDLDDTADRGQLLQQLIYDCSSYRNLLEQVRMQQRLENQLTAGREDRNRFLERLGLAPGEDPAAQLAYLQECLQKMENRAELYNRAVKEKTEFEKQLLEKGIRPDQLEKEISDTDSLEKLTGRLARLEEELNSLQEQLNLLERQAEKEADELQTVEDIEEERSLLAGEKEALEHRYEVITRTRQYLMQAKEQFAARYMDPIRKGFEKYYAMICPEEDRRYEIDANWNINLVEAGGVHDIEYLSAGYQDLVGLCRRMAMVEAMYDHEKPFLIFDDPFVNLDEKKLEKALAFTREIAKEYQVICFSCHRSRV